MGHVAACAGFGMKRDIPGLEQCVTGPFQSELALMR
jgi:hypothetical protein